MLFQASEFDAQTGLTFVNALLMVTASIILAISVKKYRRDLLLWLFAFSIQALSHIVSLLGKMKLVELPSVFGVMGLGTFISAIALLFIVWASLDQYRRVFGKNKKKKLDVKVPISSLMLVMITMDADFFINATLMLIIAFCCVLLFRIYNRTKTPTHLFLFVSLFGMTANVAETIFVVGLPNFYSEINQAMDVVLAASLLMTAIVVVVEQMLLEKQQKLEESNQVNEKIIER
ncbi:unnamed protein product, partial [marine sediment metagenome]